MTFYTKQKGKRNCGQISVACLTDHTIEEIEELVGHSNGTTTAALLLVLSRVGYQAATSRCISWFRWRDELPKMGLAQVHGARHGSSRRGWHWVAIGEDKIWDSDQSGPQPIPDYLGYLDDIGSKITSTLEVTFAGVKSS